MSAEESVIWGKFLARFGNNYARFDYDLRVGTGIAPAADVPQPFKQDYIDLTKKRIDAVGYNGYIATIFEVKNRSSLSAIGQLLGYKQLFLQSFPDYSVPFLILVCGSAAPDDLKVLKSFEISVEILP